MNHEQSAKPELRTLIIEDSPQDTELILLELRKNFDISYEVVNTASEFKLALKSNVWDVILADYSLPYFSGLKALELFHQTRLDIPFIIVSGSIDEEKAVEIMRAGARDFISKRNLSRLVPSIQRETDAARTRHDWRVQEERRRLLELAIQDALWDWDLVTDARTWNDAIYGIFDFRPDDVQPLNQWWYEHIHPEDRTHVIETLRLALDTGASFWSEEYRFQKGSGEYSPVIDRGYIICNHLKQPIRIVGLMIDISNRTGSPNIEGDKIHIGAAASRLSHELRMPLHNILSSTSMLLDGKLGTLNEKQGEYLELIEKNSNQLLFFVNDILELAKMEAGKAKLKKEAFPVKSLIGETCQLMKPLMTEKQQECQCHFDEETPELFTGDPVRLKQVLTNLVSNAIKFSPPGSRIEIRGGREDQDLILSVKDSGVGIPREDLEKVFTPFEQGSQEYSGRVQGTGLGLPLVKKLVELHNGQLEIDSEPGIGSEFKVRLPLE